MANIDRKERKLGYFESYAATIPSCVVSMVAVLSSSSSNKAAEGRLTDEAIRRGVEYIANRHPHLRCTLYRTDDDELNLRLNEPAVSKLDQSHLEIIAVESDDGWKDIVHKESNTGFNLGASIPYWRVVFIRGPESDVLLVKYHHCIADGTSGWILINDLLTAATSSANANTASNNEDKVHELPMLPSVDKMCFPSGRSAEDEEYVERALITLRKKRSDWYPRLEYSPEPSAGNVHSILYRDGTIEGLDRLLDKCRSRGVTVGSVLGAATYFAVAKMNDAKNPENNNQEEDDDDRTGKEFRFDFDMDVNLRKRLPKSLGNDHVGAYIGMMSFNLSLTPSTTFWDFVQTMRDAIETGLNEKQHFHYLEVNRRLDEQIEESPLEDKAWKLDDGHAQDMNFSNIGRYPFSPVYGNITVDKIYCVGGGWCPTFGAYVFLIPSVTSLNFSLVYESAKLNDAVANDFFDSVCSLVERSPNLSESFTLEDYMSE